MKRKRLLTSATATVVAVVLAGGVAYATIPGAGNVYSACMLKGVGTIRLIDKSLPSTNLMSRCTDKEIEVTWNQAGQPGPPGDDGAAGASGANGADGADGADGQDGVSVTSAVEPAGTNCPHGGSNFVAASGVTYACNGRDGSAAPSAVFGSAAILLGDPPVDVFSDPSIGTISVGCVFANGALDQQVEYTNTTSTPKTVDMRNHRISIHGGEEPVPPGASQFLGPDHRILIGPSLDTIPGVDRGDTPNASYVSTPFAIVDVFMRIPFSISHHGTPGSNNGCLYTVAVTLSR